MTDLIETAAADAEKAIATVKADVAPVRADIKALIASRLGDALIAALVLGSVLVGHAI